VADGYLPEGGHILITTRNPDSLKIPAEGLQIPVLGEDAAIELLRIRTKSKDFSDDEKKQASELVKELGYLALAIEQVSAIIRVSVSTIPQFLQIYRKSRKRVLRRKPDGNNPYPNSVAAAFLLSLDQVKKMKHGKQALKLLRILVFLNPDGILLDFLRAGCGGLNGKLRKIVQDELKFHEVLECLQTVSLLVISQKNRIVIHRIIQAVVKDTLSSIELYASRNTIIEICVWAFPHTFDTKDTRDRCRMFQDQVLEPVLEAAKVRRSWNASRLLSKIGLFLNADGKYVDAARLQRLGLDISRTKLFGGKHWETLANMNNLALIYWNQGKWREAAELQEKVLEAMTRTLGKEHPDTLMSMSNLASTYLTQGNLREAAELEEKVLEAKTRTLGEEHPSTVTSMHSLACIYEVQGKKRETTELQEKVLEARTRMLGEEDTVTLTSMFDLACTYFDLGRIPEAIDLLRKSSAGCERVLGDGHLYTVNRKHMLDRWIMMGDLSSNACTNLLRHRTTQRSPDKRVTFRNITHELRSGIRPGLRLC
jgi:tetratricopeptide (TPR) repeat protein